MTAADISPPRLPIRVTGEHLLNQCGTGPWHAADEYRRHTVQAATTTSREHVLINKGQKSVGLIHKSIGLERVLFAGDVVGPAIILEGARMLL